MERHGCCGDRCRPVPWPPRIPRSCPRAQPGAPAPQRLALPVATWWPGTGDTEPVSAGDSELIEGAGDAELVSGAGDTELVQGAGEGGRALREAGRACRSRAAKGSPSLQARDCLPPCVAPSTCCGPEGLGSHLPPCGARAGSLREGGGGRHPRAPSACGRHSSSRRTRS